MHHALQVLDATAESAHSADAEWRTCPNLKTYREIPTETSKARTKFVFALEKSPAPNLFILLETTLRLALIKFGVVRQERTDGRTPKQGDRDVVSSGY